MTLPVTDHPRILLVRLSAVGDCLHAVPVLVALRRHFPTAYLGWAIEEASYQLLQGHPLVDRFHIFPRRAFKKKEGGWLDRMRKLGKFRRDLREARYEIALDVQGLTKSGLVSWWSRASRRIGFAGAESRELNRLFCNRRVAIPDVRVHVVERNLALLSALGLERPPQPEWAMPDYGPEAKELENFLSSANLGAEAGRRPFAVVNPGATWFTKRWPPEQFGAVAKELAVRMGLPVVATWAGDEERADAVRIVELAGGGNAAFLAPPTSLRQLAALCGMAALFVGNDTGPLHLAVAMGTPSVAVFGASDPRRNGPYGPPHRALANGPECQPCWKRECARGDLACLTSVTPEQVLDACRDLLPHRREALPC